MTRRVAFVYISYSRVSSLPLLLLSLLLLPLLLFHHYLS